MLNMVLSSVVQNIFTNDIFTKDRNTTTLGIRSQDLNNLTEL